MRNSQIKENIDGKISQFPP